jgi:purine-binding chemotaxis protein CheW
MAHDPDDVSPELDRDGMPLPDLASAFLAGLDEVPRPGLGSSEMRLEAALDLSVAMDAFAPPAQPVVVDAPIAPAAIEAAAGAPSAEAPVAPLVEPAVTPIALLPPAFALTAPAAVEEPEPDVDAPDGLDALDAFEVVDEPVVAQESLAFEEPAVAEPSAEETAAAAAADAAEEAAADAPLDLEEFIVFSLADTRCVVPIRNVVEVGRIPDAAPVPNAPAWLHGLGNLRGQVLSLIDLRAFLGLGRIRPSAGRMIVLRADADDVVAGLMVDQVHQIVSLSPSRFQPAPATLPPGYGGFVWGVCDYGSHSMIGLDVDSVLGAEGEQGEVTLAV